MSEEPPSFAGIPLETEEVHAAERVIGDVQPGNLQEQADQKEALWAEAKSLLEQGKPWQALPKKAEAIGLKPLEGFYSMAAQEIHKRQDLADMGTPLSDSRGASEHFYVKAAALLYPGNPKGGEGVLKDINAAANQPRNGVEAAVDQARQALDRIEKERQRLQYKSAFDEVGLFTRNSGYLAARGGNGDLLVRYDSPEARQALSDAGYKDGSEYGITIGVPFNNDEDSRKGVNWVTGTGVDVVAH